MKLIKPKEITLEGKTFVISKFPAFEGLDIAIRIPLTGIPKIGDYKEFKVVLLEILSYVGKPMENMPEGILRFTEKQIINNHVENPETVYELIREMIKYNYSFFQDGRALTLFEGIAQKLPAWISKMLADLLGQLLPLNKQDSTN